MNHRKKIPTVTIALSAYNEEANIGRFLQSVLSQEEIGFTIKKILIISDGSTDRTVAHARRIRSKKIEIRIHSSRKGKSTRLNEIYRDLKTDLLVQTDADVIFGHTRVVHDIIQPLLKKNDIAMTGGNPHPLPAETFLEKAVNCTTEAYIPLRSLLKGGSNVFSVDGRLLAYRKTLVKQIAVPADMIANDAYTYFACLTLGMQYRHCSSAIVYFRSPQNIRDQVRQNTRFVSAPKRMKRYFDIALVEKEYAVPSDLMRALKFRQAAQHPILCAYIFFVNAYCRYRSHKIEASLTAQWQIALSTKRGAEL